LKLGLLRFAGGQLLSSQYLDKLRIVCWLACFPSLALQSPSRRSWSRSTFRVISCVVKYFFLPVQVVNFLRCQLRIVIFPSPENRIRRRLRVANGHSTILVKQSVTCWTEIWYLCSCYLLLLPSKSPVRSRTAGNHVTACTIAPIRTRRSSPPLGNFIQALIFIFSHSNAF
jgi:hypothetical protein